MDSNPHVGHRKRLRNELLKQGFPESIPSHKMLEALLFYGIPRKDTNPIAHELLEKFGSLSAVFEAEPDDLLQISGMTENAVTLIKMILPLERKMQSDKFREGCKFTSLDVFGEHIVKKCMGYNKEVLMVFGFDIRGKMVCEEIVSTGDIDNISVSVKEVVRVVLRRNPTTVIIAHNHINSPAVPSRVDLQMTQSLKYTLEQINIRLIDHIIVSGNDYVSLHQSSEYSNIF